MGPKTVARKTAPRDRAFLALLFLAGVGAVAFGLYQLLVLGISSPNVIFDTVLGIAILLVTVFFIGPSLAPRWFGDPFPPGTDVERPYLLPVQRADGESNGAESSPTRPAANPTRTRPVEPGIPRWADPLLPAVETGASRRNATPIGRSAPVSVEPADDEVPDLLSDWPVAPEGGGDEIDREVPTGGEMIRELDLISAELRNPPRRATWSKAPGTASVAVSGSDHSPDDDADDPLAGLY